MAEFKDPLDPATGENKSGMTGIVMLHKTGTNGDKHWFRFRPGYDADIILIEWPKAQGMFVIVETAIARVLLSPQNKWARPMDADEIAECNESLNNEEEIR